ncbi:MAG: hypothetical protein AVDCRST_MAG27-3356, partial [uncultured Craurococcus sp.]
GRRAPPRAVRRACNQRHGTRRRRLREGRGGRSGGRAAPARRRVPRARGARVGPM